MTDRISRRSLLSAGAGTGLAALAAACAPAASDIPTPGGRAPAGAAWQNEWDDLVSAAKREGSLVTISLTGVGYREAFEAFQEAFPGIHVEHQAFSSATTWVPKVQQERAAGVYTFDVGLIPTTSALVNIKPAGGFDPVRDVIFRPDVLEDKAWKGGYEDGYVDFDRKWCYTFTLNANRSWAYDSNVVKDGEIKSIRDLLNPKFKGKMILADVRMGHTYWPCTSIREQMGQEVLKKLLVDQEPAFTRDLRQMAESVIRGRYVISLGANNNQYREFWDKGIGQHVKLTELEGASYASGSPVFLFNKAPHPNAAKLFINWLLSREGQDTYTGALQNNSRRADVEPHDLDTLPEPGRKYFRTDTEEVIPKIEETQALIKGLVGIKD